MPDLDETLPNIKSDSLHRPDLRALSEISRSAHKPRILLLYGSVRPRSYSRFLTQEAARLLDWFGAETRIFDPSGLPLPDDADPSFVGQHSSKARFVRARLTFSDGHTLTTEAIIRVGQRDQ